MENKSRWAAYKRILCIRPDNMGDVLMTTPAFRALKESVPGRTLTLLTSSAGAAVSRYIPEIDEVITFDVPWVQNGQAAGRDQTKTLIEQLQQQCFDAAVIFNVQSQNPLPTALLCYLAGIPHVLGYCRENPYHLLTDWMPDPEILVATRHEVDRQLDLVAAVGSRTAHKRLSLTVSRRAVTEAVALLSAAGVEPERPWLILHAGVSEEKRRYPAREYVESAGRLIRESDYQIVLTGSAGERPYVESVSRDLGRGAFNLAGAFSLETFIGLVRLAPVLISNNTGPVHIAAALGTPVVVLYAMTNPQHTPWMVPSRVLYFEVPDHLRSRNSLLQRFPEPAEPKASPDRIVEAVGELAALKQAREIVQNEDVNTHKPIRNECTL